MKKKCVECNKELDIGPRGKGARLLGIVPVKGDDGKTTNVPIYVCPDQAKTCQRKYFDMVRSK